MQLLNSIFNYTPPHDPHAEVIKSLDDWESEGDIQEAKKQLIDAIRGWAMKVDLGGLHLTTLPLAIGELKGKTFIALHNNNLETIPSVIGKLTNLETLTLAQNNLKTIPSEIGNLTSLTDLILNDNNLESLPLEIGKLARLEKLLVNDNKLKTIPSQIGILTNLVQLRLNGNKLQALPSEIGALTKLMRIELSHNQLRSLPPEIYLCRNLQWLLLQYNPDLCELPMSLGQIPGLTYIYIDHTGISSVIRDSILDQCQALRRTEAGEMLPKRLHTWKTAANSSVDLTNITNAQKIDINEWLTRLERTRDYSRSQAKLAAIVCSMLQTVCDNEEFKELFFTQVGANNASCEDRAAMSLNEIYTSWKSGAHDLKIMTGVAKTLALRKELAKRIPPGESESVEIYLYYETLFKDQLCTAIEGMAFAAIGKRDWIDEEELMKRVNETFFDHLMELPVFEKLVQVELKSEWERIVNMAQDCPEGDELSDAVLKWQEEVMQERKRAWYECVKRWYDNAAN